jgi:hypothetical protein
VHAIDRLRALVVDGTLEHAEMVMGLLRASKAWHDVECSVAASYQEALGAFEKRPFDVAFVDYWLGDGDGLALLSEVRARGITTPVIVLTDRSAEGAAVEAMRAGASDFLTKADLNVETVERATRHALALHGEEEQRRQAEAATRASEERFRALVENSSDIILLLDAEARVLYTSQSTTRHLGWVSEQLVGRVIFELVHPTDLDLAQTRLADVLEHPGRVATAEVQLRHADGTWRTVEGIGVNRLNEPAVHAIVVNARDITERRRLEQRLRQSQKMEAVGELAGGVAHDFNNLLTTILGYCDLLLDDLMFEGRARRDLIEIRTAGERAAALTRQLLAFSRRQMLQPRRVDLNDVIRQLDGSVRDLVGSDVQLVTTLAPDLLAVRVDPSSIEQVVLSLASNARDAMPSGGRLDIHTANVDVDGAHRDAHVAMLEGRYVVLSVSDTGHGMSPETSARVFEPFFTTRAMGKGSGLGLATVYGIVKQSGGYIWVHSEPGHGAAFKVYLPPDDMGQAVVGAR